MQRCWVLDRRHGIRSLTSGRLGRMLRLRSDREGQCERLSREGYDDREARLSSADAIGWRESGTSGGSPVIIRGGH